MKIISRAQWGAKRTPNAPRPLSAVTGFYVHYHGTPPPASTGVWVPKNIEAIHLGNGWNNGVGYHFVVDQAGAIYEGRGWGNVGAHSPPHNTDGIGVYVAVGGDQKPTDAALRSVRWLYDEACRRTGKALYKRWHGYDYPTACPGPHLIAWVKAGMPRQGGAASTASTKTYDRDDVRRFQRVHGLKDDGYWGKDTEKQAQAIRRCLKPGLKRSKWDLVRYWRLRLSRKPRSEQSSVEMRKGIQWALKVESDGIWGPATDAAWHAIRDQHKMKGV